jgi:hypothetical protein
MAHADTALVNSQQTPAYKEQKAAVQIESRPQHDWPTMQAEREEHVVDPQTLVATLNADKMIHVVT